MVTNDYYRNLPMDFGKCENSQCQGELSHFKTNTSKCSVNGDGVSSPNLNDVTLHQQRIDRLLSKV